jgi:hypothetical protein
MKHLVGRKFDAPDVQKGTCMITERIVLPAPK